MPHPTHLEMLRSLVEASSVSSLNKSIDESNADVISHLANWLNGLNFKVEVLTLPSDPKKKNLVATKGQGEKGIVFAGHTDTVPTDETLWHTDPWELTKKNGRVYGLGTCDMKGFFPVAIAAAAAVNESKLKEPIMIVATSDEESSMSGARYLQDLGKPKAEVAIIGEPTSMAPVFAHKGIMLMRVEIQGKAGHSSNPEAGCSALDVANALMNQLTCFREQLRRKHQNAAFAVDYPTMNLGCLHAGDSPNRICSHAELQFDLRLLPGIDHEKTFQELGRIVRRVEAQYETEIEFSLDMPAIPAYQTSLDGKLLKSIQRAVNKPPSTVSFGTEAPFFSQLGMETVVFGPGSIDQAHQANEYLDLAQIDPSQRVLESLIHQYCVDV